MADHCPHCGIEYGMAFGTGDCGCEEDFDVGMGMPTAAGAAASAQATESWSKAYFGAKPLKVQIELEGPGKMGLSAAMNFLELSNYLEEGETEGTFQDTQLQVRGSWKLIP